MFSKALGIWIFGVWADSREKAQAMRRLMGNEVDGREYINWSMWDLLN
jgi:hypothetical protein